MAVKLLLDFSSTCNSREKNITDCRVELVLSRSNPRQWCRDILWPIIVLSGVLKGSDWVTYTGSRGLRGWEQLNGISKSLSDAHWWDHSTPVLSPIYVRKQMEKKKKEQMKKNLTLCQSCQGLYLNVAFILQTMWDKIAPFTHTLTWSQTDLSVRRNLGDVQAFLICQRRLGEPYSNRNGRSS